MAGRTGALSLSRRQDESVVIEVGGQSLLLTVVQTGRKTKLRFAGPKAFKVTREELLLSKKGGDK